MKNLKTQKRLAADIFGVGENKVLFNKYRIDDIHQAITRADIADLIKDKAITVKIPNKKIFKKEKRKKRRGHGKRKIMVLNRKTKYVNRIRKIRRFLSEIREKNIIDDEEYYKLRGLAKAGTFKSRRHLKEYLTAVMKKKLDYAINNEKEEGTKK